MLGRRPCRADVSTESQWFSMFVSSAGENTSVYVVTPTGKSPCDSWVVLVLGSLLTAAAPVVGVGRLGFVLNRLSFALLLGRVLLLLVGAGH